LDSRRIENKFAHLKPGYEGLGDKFVRCLSLMVDQKNMCLKAAKNESKENSEVVAQ
jgi:hypothetical protein